MKRVTCSIVFQDLFAIPFLCYMPSSIDSTSWFETWFDTAYYHVLYANRDHKEAGAFIDRSIEILNLKSKAKVMDLACGKGRHALHLASKGFKVTGLDLSENSIAGLRSLNDDSLHFQRWDMRDTYDVTGFDAVFNLFTSFGYFDSMQENLKVLKAMKAVLNEDGHILIDYLNVKKALAFIGEEDHIERQGLEFHTSKEWVDGCIVKHIKVTDQDKEFFFKESVQALTLEDFSSLTNEAGLKIQDCYGDYHLAPYDASRSPRLILHIRKAGNA